MATLPTQSFSTIVSNIAAGMQARISSFLNFAIGSVLLAIAETYAGVVLWLQGMILSVAMLTRLATSYGSDVDSWIDDFGIITRLPAVAATGLVVFSRYTAAASTPIIPIGSVVKTTDGTESFQVYADTTNPLYSATAGGTEQNPIAGYVMPSQATSIAVPVVCITDSPNSSTFDPWSGGNGNVAANSISVIASEIQGIDTVSNPAAITNGSDQETDAALKVRFRAAIAALSRATPEAIAFAVESVQTNIQVIVLSNTGPQGQSMNGMTTVYVDDGSGAIGSTLLAACQAAAFAYLAAGTSMGVYAATKVSVNVSLTVNVLPGYSQTAVFAAVSAAIANGINAAGLGNGIPYFTVGAWALAVPGVASIEALTVNGGTADLPAVASTTYKANNVVIG